MQEELQPIWQDLPLVPPYVQNALWNTFVEELLRALLSDMDGVLTLPGRAYREPRLIKALIRTLVALNRDTTPGRRGVPLQILSVVSARDILAQWAVPGMPEGIYNFGGLSTRYSTPERQVIYTGDENAHRLWVEVLGDVVSNLYTAGRGEFNAAYIDNRHDGGNILGAGLPKRSLTKMLEILQGIADSYSLGQGTPLTFESRSIGHEPNGDFLSQQMIQYGKSLAVTQFAEIHPNIGFFHFFEDTPRWLRTFAAGAESLMKRPGSQLLGYQPVLVDPTAKVQHLNEEGWIVVPGQKGLQAYVKQYDESVRRAAQQTRRR